MVMSGRPFLLPFFFFFCTERSPPDIVTEKVYPESFFFFLFCSHRTMLLFPLNATVLPLINVCAMFNWTGMCTVSACTQTNYTCDGTSVVIDLKSGLIYKKMKTNIQTCRMFWGKTHLYSEGQAAYL